MLYLYCGEGGCVSDLVVGMVNFLLAVVGEEFRVPRTLNAAMSDSVLN